MSLNMTLRRMKCGFTTHGMRSSFRDYAAETGVEFSVAEQCLAHSVGNAVTAAYLRTSMLERRRPTMIAWSAYVCGADASNVVPMRRA